MTNREMFEQWVNDNDMPINLWCEDGVNYYFAVAQMAWAAWQASSEVWS